MSGMRGAPAMLGQMGGPPGQPAPGGGQGGQSDPRQHPLTQMAQQAAVACGQLVEACKRIPGVNPQAVEQAAAQLRQGITALVAALPKGQQGQPGAGQPPPGGQGAAPPQAGPPGA